MAKIDDLVQDFLAQKIIAVVGVSDKRETGANILFGQFRIIGDDLLVRHSCRKPTQNIGHGDAQPANTRPAPAFAWFNGDDVLVVHDASAYWHCAPIVA